LACARSSGVNAPEIGLAEQGFLKALVFDLVDEHAFRPTELACHAQVELPLLRVLALTHDDQIVTPSDLCNQWLHFCVVPVAQKELAHVKDVPTRKTGDSWKFRTQVTGELLRDGQSMFGIALPLYDHLSDVPV